MNAIPIRAREREQGSGLRLGSSRPSEVPRIRRGEVHVWRADLDALRETGSDPEAILSADERARAARFRFAHDGERFAAARACLRRLLARYGGAESPERVRLEYGPFGKPRLASADGTATSIEFNASHSGSMVIFVLARRRVGVDIETISPVAADDERLSPLWLSDVERAGFAALGDEERTRHFYRLWTRREAYLKGRGCGLSGIGEPLPGEDEKSRWSIRDLRVGREYAAALAVEGRIETLRDWCLNGSDLATGVSDD